MRKIGKPLIDTFLSSGALFLMVLISEDLYTFVATDGKGYAIGSDCAGWSYRSEAAYIVYDIGIIATCAAAALALFLVKFRPLETVLRLVNVAISVFVVVGIVGVVANQS